MARCRLRSAPVHRTHDTRNRLLTLRFPDGLGDQDWVYTPDGLPDQVTTWNGVDHTVPVINAYSYNARRMLDGQGESISQPAWYTWALGYGFDRNGHLANHVYPNDLTVDYTPNALGQPTKAGTFATGATYHPGGAIKQFTYGNGITHTTSLHGRGLPHRILDEHVASATRVLDDTLDYGPNANLLAITDGATNRAQRGNRDMTYDGQDRLLTASSPMWNGTAGYAYDVLDNLEHVVVPQTAMNAARNLWYCYDETNRLTNLKTGGCATGATVSGLGYDVRGNLVNFDGQAYQFDFGNRLRVVNGLEHYRYDGLGRRVLSWSPTKGNVLSQYSQDGRLVYQHDARTSKGVAHVYLAGRLVATREHDLPDGTNPVVTYLHTDALGSPAVATKADGSVLHYSEYEPFGLRLNRANDNRPGFTGHVMDAETGLVYMQQRYYDPGIGMFLSVDPVTAYSNPIGQFHRYRYANNNPYRFTDPDGRVVRSPIEDREQVQNQINEQSQTRFEYNDSGSLEATDQQNEGNTSSAYSASIQGAIDSDKTLTISVQQTYQSDGRTVDIDSEHGGGVTGRDPATGNVVIGVTGNGLTTVDAAGNAIVDSAADTLRHEIVSHGSPQVQGVFTGNGIELDNATRAELGKPMLPSDPDHKVYDP